MYTLPFKFITCIMIGFMLEEFRMTIFVSDKMNIT